ncbi:MAG: hypothetical protein ACM3XS_06510, partial [Bacteroidota bacterium]
GRCGGSPRARVHLDHGYRGGSRSFDNDNTGATLSWTNEVVCQGSHALAVTPSGKAAETKVALPFSGDKVQLWQAAKFLVVSFYLAPECELIPNMFFLGMADVTKDWAWVDGIFAKAEVKAGWNQISYPLSQARRKVDAAHKYKIYLALAVQGGGNKTPLVDRFYLDGVYGTQE